MNDGWFFRVFRCSFLLVASFDMEVPDHLQEQFVDAGVVGQFGVEGCDEHVALSGCDDSAIDGCKDFNVRAGLLDIGSTNEGHRHFADAFELAFAVETPQLPAVGIASGKDIHYAQMVPVEHNETCASAQDGQTSENRFP